MSHTILKNLVARPLLHPSSFTKYDPEGRYDELYLYVDNSDNNEDNNTFFRYKLTVMDRPIIPPSATMKNTISSTKNNKRNTKTKTATNNTIITVQYAMIVFIIPMGRETEYMFTNRKHGLLNIAQSANTVRLVMVSLGRHPYHTFPGGIQQIQSELQYVVQIIHQQAQFISGTLNNHYTIQVLHPNPTVIPFMTLSNDNLGQRDCLQQGCSALSGKYYIEQVTIDMDTIVRRLYFELNPFVIQSEVAIVRTASSDDKNDIQINQSHIAFQYHKIATAGILAFLSFQSSSNHSVSTITPTAISTSSQTVTVFRGLLIGLGAGGLVHYLQYLLDNNNNSTNIGSNDDTTNNNKSNDSMIGCNSNHHWHELIAVELDPTILTIAEEYFGIVQTKSNKTYENNGVDHSDMKDNFSFQIICGNGLMVHPAATTELSSTTTGKSTESATDPSLSAITAILFPVASNTNTTTTEDISSNITISLAEASFTKSTAAPSSSLPIESNNNNNANDNNPILLDAHSLSYIIIDVDSKDTTVGMSCPPVEFINIHYLQTLSQLLMLPQQEPDEHCLGREMGGILAMNVSARDPKMLHAVCTNVQQVFKNVYVSTKKFNNHQHRTGEECNENITAGCGHSNNNDDDDNANYDESENEDEDDLNVVVFAYNHYKNTHPTNNNNNASNTSDTAGTDILDDRLNDTSINCNPFNYTKDDSSQNKKDDTIRLLRERLSSFVQKSVDPDIVVDMVECLDKITLWSNETRLSSSSSNHDSNTNGKPNSKNNSRSHRSSRGTNKKRGKSRKRYKYK